MQRDIQTLATCGRRLLQAKDGRGRRWPVAHCTQALIVAGTPAAIAQGCADAIARVVITVQARAAAGRSGRF